MKSLTHYIQALQSRGYKELSKYYGWTTDRKIVVIESDDWGSIRMPSHDVLKYLQSKGVKLNPELGYDKYDTLASNTDLELLLETLDTVEDKNGNSAKITFNTVMANPDFQKIKESSYTEFHYELFTETLKRYPNHDRAFSLWQEGINKKLIQPQFHAREHLNVQLWLRALREDWEGTRLSFEKGVFCNYFDKSLDCRGRFLETYNIMDDSEYEFILDSIEDGLKLFEETFGFKSESMIAPNYTWDRVIEKKASEKGVRYLQGGFTRRNTMVDKKNGNKTLYSRYMGERNDNNQVCLIRNCLFEPSQNDTLNAENCLRNIRIMFEHKKPAIICSHRLNYIGGLDLNNRDRTLRDFEYLLKTIVDIYPNVEFMSSDELGDIIVQEYKE